VIVGRLDRTLSRAWSPHVFFFAEIHATAHALCSHVGTALASKKIPRRELVPPRWSDGIEADFVGTTIAFRSCKAFSMGRQGNRREARMRDGVVTSVSVGGATTYIAAAD